MTTNPSALSLVTPELIVKVLTSLNPKVSLERPAAEYLADVFNESVENALRAAHQCAVTRATGASRDAELGRAKYAPRGATTQYLSGLDTGETQLTAADFDRYIRLPADYRAALATAEDPSLFGPIKPFS